MPLKKLNVGQVVYILSNKAEAVLPALVVKEHRTTHLHGEEVNWTVSYGPPGKEKTIDSSKIDGELFGTLDEVRDVMSSRFMDYVENLVNNAANLQGKWYPKSDVPAQTSGDRLDPGAMIQEMEESLPRAPMKVTQNRGPRVFDREELKRQLQAEDGEDGVFEDQPKMKLRPDGSIDME